MNITKTLVAMTAGAFVIYTSLYWVQPLIMVFSERFNQSPASASLVLSLTTIAIAFSLLLAPLVSNELGRKRTMVLALVLTSSLNSISLIVDNFYWLLLIRLLIGICISGFLASVITYLKEEVERNKLGMVVGIYVGGTALGGVLARIISSSMIGYVELNTLAFIIGIVTMLASIFFWLLLPSSKHFIKRKYSIRNLGTGFIECLLNKRILSIYICTFFTIGIYTSVLNYISYPLAEPPFLLNQSFIGLIYIATLSGVIGSILFGRFVERVFDISLYRIALTIMTVGVILTTSSFLWLVITGLLLLAFGIFASNTIASNWIANNSHEPYKAEANSLYSIFYYVGSSVIGWVSGYIFQYLGWSLFMILISIILTLLIYTLRNLGRDNNSHLLLDVNR